jgi:hypothetical protein
MIRKPKGSKTSPSDLPTSIDCDTAARTISAQEDRRDFSDVEDGVRNIEKCKSAFHELSGQFQISESWFGIERAQA